MEVNERALSRGLIGAVMGIVILLTLIAFLIMPKVAASHQHSSKYLFFETSVRATSEEEIPHTTRGIFPSSLPFGVNDFRNFSGLLQKLTEATADDPLSLYLKETLELRQGLTPASLSSGFNQLLHNQVIYREERFANVTLSDETKAALAKNPQQGTDLIVLNRLLLEDAYSELIKKSPFPCTRCHERDAEVEVDHNKREIPQEHLENADEYKFDVAFKFEHDAKNRWCLDCHDAKNRDKLHLASGELLDFDDSYRLCGQCHGDKLRDWKFGIHGKRTGHWQGEKTYYLCVQCHNPHSPKFKPLKPLSPPHKPSKAKSALAFFISGGEQ